MSDNPITQISTDDLRTMSDKEGLVLQGCGGPLQEWVDGINDLLTEAGILRDGSRFETVSTFRHDGLTCLLFPFENVKLTWAGWPCGGSRPTANSAAHGCPTMSRTDWVVLKKNRPRRKSPK